MSVPRALMRAVTDGLEDVVLSENKRIMRRMQHNSPVDWFQVKALLGDASPWWYRRGSNEPFHVYKLLGLTWALNSSSPVRVMPMRANDAS